MRGIYEGRKGNKSPNFGSHRSDKTRLRMSIARKQFIANKNRLKEQVSLSIQLDY